jgi:hypothetical protein
MVSLSDALATAGEIEGAGEWQGALRQSITQLIDDYCGTVPHRIPWHWPGPRPWVLQAISQLNLVTQNLQEGSLRSSLQEATGQLAQQAFRR